MEGFQLEAKTCKESRVVRTSRIFPNDLNNHKTMFGGKLMSDVDIIASISAQRHSRAEVVTASTDSVDFLHPITQKDSICMESYVTWTGSSSMEIFVKIIAENLRTAERKIAATAFLTFVALDDDGKPVRVPAIIPETDEEKKLHETGKERAEYRKIHRRNSKELASHLTTTRPWE
ncbi:acyl-CoA thioesterase [Neobacillus sp. PS3-12]|jgi:acyl-CoA hydrolase|uniref:acyl-CoA thioesterase n=1 Tax=Neobacillus sp. PS3-12 TaxID=3070677 RepID=UPI0027E186CB|nr:acyl-CoA thioesterase [Neobacillus sp. PS3-12]WML54664.1 acyl-CoA thioesterase [Neobacillus sp. PS3-12]